MPKNQRLESNANMNSEICSCIFVVLGVVFLVSFCQYVSVYSQKEGFEPEKSSEEDGKQGHLDLMDQLASEGVQCMKLFRSDFNVWKNETFAEQCYTNPFFLWTGVVALSVVASAFCLI